MLFSYVSGQQWIDGNKKCWWIAGNFDCHGDAAVPCGAQGPLEHIQVFTRSHWMPPLVDCLRCITPAATMVKEFKWNTQNTNKTHLLASNYGTFQSLVVCDNFNPKTDTQLSSSMQQASCKCEMPRLELKCHDWSWRAQLHWSNPRIIFLCKIFTSILLKTLKSC